MGFIKLSVEAYAQEDIKEGDPFFAHYLIKPDEFDALIKAFAETGKART